jgi:hypothetical protein
MPPVSTSAHGSKARRIEAILAAGQVAEDVRNALIRELGWRPLEIVEVRPDRMLSGGSFAGFAHEHLRREYVEAGEERARRVLAELEQSGL